MVRNIYHFSAERVIEDLILSPEHKLPGYVAQYLKKFQLDGIRFMYRHYNETNKACILNDDSGFGKTIQVVGFLEAIFSNDLNKKCLIIVKDDEQITNWKFHFDVFTKFETRVIFKKEDGPIERIFITKWNSIFKSTSLYNMSFDYIILDDRRCLLENTICSSYLMKHYKNKISLIIASIDITTNLELLHVMLKLCGLLNKDYENFKCFNEKFSLPSCKNKGENDVLEAYFLRREKLINFCRDFRLRRYQHQYEDVLPLVTLDEYENSIKSWKICPIKAAYSSSSDSVGIISSSDKDTEDLFQSFFTTKEERKLNKEVSKTINLQEPINVLRRESIEEVEMSPLLFESDTDDDDDDNIIERNVLEKSNECEREIQLHKEKKKNDDVNIQNSKSNESKKECKKSNSTRSNHKEKQNNDTVVIPNSQVYLKKLRERTPKIKQNISVRETRNLCKKITRSSAQKHNYTIPDISVNLKRIDNMKRRKKRQNIKKQSNLNDNNEKICEENDNESTNNFQKTLSIDSKYDFKIDLVNKIALQQNTSEVHIISPKVRGTENQIIVLSGTSSEDSDQKIFVKKQISNGKRITMSDTSSSPDLFASNNGYDYNITCNQKARQTTTIKDDKIQSKNTKTCLVRLPRFEKVKHKNCNSNNSSNSIDSESNKDMEIELDKDIILEISDSPETNKTTGPCDSDNKTLQIRNKATTSGGNDQNNKITKYLINSESSSPLLPMPTFSFDGSNLPQAQATDAARKIQCRRNSEIPKTPKRQKLSQKSLTTSKKSKFIKSNECKTPTNGLTKWLIRSSLENNSTTFCKRRRLDLSFKNL